MIISWNVRGLNKAGNIKEISSHLLKSNLTIVILIERRVKKNNVDMIGSKLRH